MEVDKEIMTNGEFQLQKISDEFFYKRELNENNFHLLDLEVKSINDSYLKKYSRYSEKFKERGVSSDNDNISEINTFVMTETTKIDNVNNETLFTFSFRNKSKEETKDNLNEINLTTNPGNSYNQSTINRSDSSKIINYSTSSSRYSLPRRKNEKKIFEEFLVIGIESEGLEYINDLNELCLTPKIIYNFPNKLSENELNL